MQCHPGNGKTQGLRFVKKGVNWGFFLSFPPGRNSGSGPEGKCYVCGDPTHLKANCPNRGKGLQACASKIDP